MYGFVSFWKQIKLYQRKNYDSSSRCLMVNTHLACASLYEKTAFRLVLNILDLDTANLNRKKAACYSLLSLYYD